MNWENVTHSRHSKFLVKGTELNRAIVPGYLSRFQICEIRTFDGIDYDREYIIRDAETVSIQQVKEGVRPSIVGRFETIDQALEFCKNTA